MSTPAFLPSLGLLFSAVVSAIGGPTHYAAGPQDPEQLQPVYWNAVYAPAAAVLPLHANFIRAQPQDSPELLSPQIWHQQPPTFFRPTVQPYTAKPQDSPELLQPQTWRAPPPTFFAPVVQPYTAKPQDSPELLQPIWSGTKPPPPITVPLRFAVTNALQDPAQLPPIFSGLQPPSFDAPTLRPSWTARQQDSNELLQPWFARPLPPAIFRPTVKVIAASPQESPELLQPVFSKPFIHPEQPELGSTEIRSGLHAADIAQAGQSARFWGAAQFAPPPPEQPELPGAEFTFGLHAVAIAQANQSALFWSGTGHAPPPTGITPTPIQPIYVAAPQADPTQIQPAIFNAFPLPSVAPTNPPLRKHIFARGEDDTQQPQPTFSTLILATPQPEIGSAEIRSGLHQAIDQTNQWAVVWKSPLAALDTLQWIAGYTAEGEQPQELQPTFARVFGQPPPLAPPLHGARIAAPQDDPTQIQPAIFNRLPLPSIAPTNPPPRDHIFASSQDDPTQIAPAIFNRRPLPSIVPPDEPILHATEYTFGLHQVAIAQANQWALFFRALPAHEFLQAIQGYQGEEQFNPTHTQPEYFGSYPLPSIAPTPTPPRDHFFAIEQADPTQIAPWFAHHPPPSTDIPPEITVNPGAEYTFGLHAIEVAQANQSAQFWSSVLATPPPAATPFQRSFVTVDQADPTHIAPANLNHFPRPSFVLVPPALDRHTFARPEDDLTQPPPIFSQFPPPSIAFVPPPVPPDPGSYDPYHGHGKPPFDQRGRYPDRITWFGEKRVFGLLEDLVNLIPEEGIEVQIGLEPAVEPEDEEAIATVLMMLLGDEEPTSTEAEPDDEETIAMLMIMILSAEE